MRTMPTSLALAASVAIALWATALAFAPAPAQAKAKAPQGISLMQTLSDWKYPNSNFHGAKMSEGGNPALPSVKCQARLTTSDSFEKVVEFYHHKLDATAASAKPVAKDEASPPEGKSLTTQDDSDGRPVSVRVFTVNKADTSTTLVISRAKDEPETHIAWLHHIRIAGKP